MSEIRIRHQTPNAILLISQMNEHIHTKCYLFYTMKAPHKLVLNYKASTPQNSRPIQTRPKPANSSHRLQTPWSLGQAHIDCKLLGHWASL